MSKANTRRIWCVYVPIFEQYNPNLAKNESVSWFKFPTNLQICGNFATSLPQERNIFFAILCLCGLNGKSTITFDLRTISGIANTDQRTGLRAVQRLFDLDLIVDVSLEEKREEIETQHSKRREAEKEAKSAADNWKKENKPKPKTKPKTADCQKCAGQGIVRFGTGVIKCSACN